MSWWTTGHRNYMRLILWYIIYYPYKLSISFLASVTNQTWAPFCSWMATLVHPSTSPLDSYNNNSFCLLCFTLVRTTHNPTSPNAPRSFFVSFFLPYPISPYARCGWVIHFTCTPKVVSHIPTCTMSRERLKATNASISTPNMIYLTSFSLADVMIKSGFLGATFG